LTACYTGAGLSRTQTGPKAGFVLYANVSLSADCVKEDVLVPLEQFFFPLLIE